MSSAYSSLFADFFIGLTLYGFVRLFNVFCIEFFIDVLQITLLFWWPAFLLSSLDELILMKINLSTFPLKFDFYFVSFRNLCLLKKCLIDKVMKIICFLLKALLFYLSYLGPYLSQINFCVWHKVRIQISFSSIKTYN